MLQALGYAGFGSDNLDDWRQFGTHLVGFQAVERGPSLLAFRMDDRKQRVVIDRAMGEDTVLASHEPIPGQDVHLSIDIELQQEIQSIFASAVRHQPS